MEIDLFADPPSAREIEAARSELENSRLLIVQNEAHVAGLYHKLMIKVVLITAVLLFTAALYFILPGSMLGIDTGRTIMIVTVTAILLISLFWISWRSLNEARAIIPDRENSKEQRQRLKHRAAALADVDVKLRLNVVNWSRADGVLTNYVKKVSRQRRHIIGLDYVTIKKHIEKVLSHPGQ